MAYQSLAPVALSPQHNVARYCRRRWLVHGGVSRDAFLLREGEPYLSTNWLEHFHQSDRQAQLYGIRAALASKFKMEADGRFAILNVGYAIDRIMRLHSVPLRFRVLGQAHDPSHTGIFGYGSAIVDPKANDVARSLAGSVRELHPAIP